jgi:hypothetical protein
MMDWKNFKQSLPDMVSQVCNSNYLGGGDWEDHGSRLAWGKSLQEPISQSNVWYGDIHAPVILAMQGSTNRRIMVQSGPGIKRDPISKITNTKRAGGTA